MHPIHWLEWLAACLAAMWLGEILRAEPVDVPMMVVDDGYVGGVDVAQTAEQIEGVSYPHIELAALVQGPAASTRLTGWRRSRPSPAYYSRPGE